MVDTNTIQQSYVSEYLTYEFSGNLLAVTFPLVKQISNPIRNKRWRNYRLQNTWTNHYQKEDTIGNYFLHTHVHIYISTIHQTGSDWNCICSSCLWLFSYFLLRQQPYEASDTIHQIQKSNSNFGKIGS